MYVLHSCTHEVIVAIKKTLHANIMELIVEDLEDEDLSDWITTSIPLLWEDQLHHIPKQGFITDTQKQGRLGSLG